MIVESTETKRPAGEPFPLAKGFPNHSTKFAVQRELHRSTIFAWGHVIHPKTNPVGLLRARLISHKEEPESSWIHNRKGGCMKKLHPNCPPKGAPLGFARSVRHWRTGQRIYPKTAKAFPIRGRKSGNDKRQLTLGV